MKVKIKERKRRWSPLKLLILNVLGLTTVSLVAINTNNEYLFIGIVALESLAITTYISTYILWGWDLPELVISRFVLKDGKYRYYAKKWRIRFLIIPVLTSVAHNYYDYELQNLFGAKIPATRRYSKSFLTEKEAIDSCEEDKAENLRKIKLFSNF